MTDSVGSAAPSASDPYSPRLRTALVLTGTGTAGAYHAGVLRALHEAGVKLDLVAGHGIGVVGALFAAIDGAQRLWDEKGFWRSSAVTSLYRWRTVPMLIVVTFALAVVIVAAPLAAVALGLLVFPVDFVLEMIGLTGGSGLAAWYVGVAQAAFAPGALPTWLPRLVVLVLGAGGLAAVAAGWAGRGVRRSRGGVWWRLAQPPLSAADAANHCWRMLWDLVRGATPLKQPTRVDLARRYTEMLTENIGQPGFRELLIAIHDLDAHRDLVFALLAEARRRDLFRRPTSDAADARRAEVFDLAGLSRDYLADAVAAALTIPLAAEPHTVTFASSGYWRGETHRLCDRPASLLRLLDEVIDLDISQIVLVSAAPESGGPHELQPPRIDGRGRLGEYAQSSEAAALRDATRMAAARVPHVFTIRPAHNPLGPFDFGGGFDDRSDRRQPLDELMSRGYEDAYRQFIEPVVGASGDRVGQGVS
jgi:patatin-like phospholipase